MNELSVVQLRYSLNLVTGTPKVYCFWKEDKCCLNSSYRGLYPALESKMIFDALEKNETENLIFRRGEGIDFAENI